MDKVALVVLLTFALAAGREANVFDFLLDENDLEFLEPMDRKEAEGPFETIADEIEKEGKDSISTEAKQDFEPIAREAGKNTCLSRCTTGGQLKTSCPGEKPMKRPSSKCCSQREVFTGRQCQANGRYRQEIFCYYKTHEWRVASRGLNGVCASQVSNLPWCDAPKLVKSVKHGQVLRACCFWRYGKATVATRRCCDSSDKTSNYECSLTKEVKIPHHVNNPALKTLFAAVGK